MTCGVPQSCDVSSCHNIEKERAVYFILRPNISVSIELNCFTNKFVLRVQDFSTAPSVVDRTGA